MINYETERKHLLCSFSKVSNWQEKGLNSQKIEHCYKCPNKDLVSIGILKIWVTSLTKLIF